MQTTFFRFLLVLLVINFISAFSYCQETVVNNTAAVELKSSNLPIIIIDTHGKVIQDEPKIIVDMKVIDNGEGIRNNITDPYTFSGKIGIEIRGSSSQSFEKKQYGVEVVDSAGEDMDVPLLGLPEESDWVFSAPYSDKSLMRNVLMYKLSNNIGRYASRSRYFELIINNDYKGIYVLFEKIKRDKNRVNIAKLNPEDTTGVELTGGYIIKIDKDEGNPNRGWFSPYHPKSGISQRIRYMYDTPGPDDINRKQESYIQTFFNDFESTMASEYYYDPDTGYETFIDLDSFVDYFLMNEFSKNVDGLRLSTFFHKDKDKENQKAKLIAGPVWDYNLAWGNADYYNASEIPGFHFVYMRDTAYTQDGSLPPFWWSVLFRDKNFHTRLCERWTELRQNEFSPAVINRNIDSLVKYLDEAKTRNFLRWKVLGQYIWPNYFIGKTYPDEIAYLKSWIRRRGVWMDEEFLTPDAVNEEYPVVNEFKLYPNYPNPFNPATNLEFDISERGQVTLKIFDILGNEIASLFNSELQPGRHKIKFDAAGFSSGIYFARLQSGTRQEVRKIMLLK